MRRVCVFCGSSPGARPAYAEATIGLARLLVARGIGVVFGGGAVGLMGVLGDTVMAEGGEAIGVIPQALVDREIGHRGLSDLRVVGSMHERKALMADLSDAFIAMPGGFGTFEEFCEIVTWAQLGLHNKPCGLLNVDGYYDPLIELFDRGLTEGFIREQHRALVLQHTDPEAMLELVLAWSPSAAEPVVKWIEREET